MTYPIINIITRVSRKNFFRRCHESVSNQTYKHIRHYCTYESSDMGQYLNEFDGVIKVKVPPYKRINNLFYSYNHHDVLDDFVNPDWEFQQKLAHVSIKEFRDKRIQVEKKQFGDFQSTSFTSRPRHKHSPYNFYMKIAECKVTDGWVFHLDDDDVFYDDLFLEKLVSQINKHNDDTLHVFRKISESQELMPSELSWKKIMSGHPFLLHDFGTSCFCFHSKYIDYTVWDEWSGADYRTAKALERIIPYKNLTSLISIKYKSHGGRSIDIVDI